MSERERREGGVRHGSGGSCSLLKRGSVEYNADKEEIVIFIVVFFLQETSSTTTSVLVISVSSLERQRGITYLERLRGVG